MIDPRILQIETCALHAWPAREAVPLDGWLLRTHTVPSRRVNSVWPNVWEGQVPLARKLELVESFYRGKGQPARYQVCPAARPPGLDEVLEARGYAVDAPTNVQIASVDSVLQRGTMSAKVTVETSDSLTESWADAYCRAEGAPESEALARKAAMERIEQPVCYVLVQIGGAVAAVGRGVFEEGWMGIFGMATHPDFRRRGAGTAVLCALANEARARGVADLYLQVMQVYTPAIRMYSGLGFETLYRYHYRELI